MYPLHSDAYLQYLQRLTSTDLYIWIFHHLFKADIVRRYFIGEYLAQHTGG